MSVVLSLNLGWLHGVFFDTTSLKPGVTTAKGRFERAGSVRIDDGLYGGIGTDSDDEDTCDDNGTDR